MQTTETSFQQLNPEIGLATTHDLADILKLQRENLSVNLTEDEKQTQGFLSAQTSHELLTTITTQEGITVAKVEGRVVGYLIPMSIEHAKKIPLLGPFIDRFPQIQIDKKPLTDFKFCVLGQVCIAKNFRGRGILEKLYTEIKQRLAEKYEIGISEISANNPRSLKAHRDKIGLKVSEIYSADGKDWHIVYLDFRVTNQTPEHA